MGGTRTIRLILIGILLTWAAIVGREYLPLRTLDLLAPASGPPHFLNFASTPAAQRRLEWVDEPHFRFRCLPGHESCGLTFLLTHADGAHGTDLRAYRSIALDMAYDGAPEVIHLGIRNFDPRFSREQDGNSARMQSMALRTIDTKDPLTVDLAELTVPEWWIQQFKLAREYNRPSFENATALFVELSYAPSATTHEIRLRRLALQGDWIGREALYLGILCTWMLCAAGVVVRRLLALRRQHRQQERDIEALVARTAQLNAEQHDLRRQAAIDPLTGLLNRRGLEQAFADLGERRAHSALIAVDIDHFKRINDGHGHDAGDQVLRRVAAVMARDVRSHDLLGRWGGEEFVVACTDCTAEQAAAVAEKIRQRIEASAFGARLRIAVTASFGVAMLHGNEELAEALRRADAALYRAKSLGRNRVVVGDCTASPPAPAADLA
ncbi:MAG TPA: GGDEF domain-containing protein [Ideonella sp.]|nr:GGDEF domain-containing protein [Ideonella sp.]